MSRFGDLLKTGEVHSAFEQETAVETTPVAPPPRPEEVIADIFSSPPTTPPPVVIDDFTNPLDAMPVANGNSLPNFKKMTKIELEEYGRTVGI